MVSVIIPIFNAVETLACCLDSVRRQKLIELECLLVDDGSTDGSGEICERIVAKDSRFKVIHQENRGVSSARNRGIDVISGEYVCFVDADDYLDPDYLLKMLFAAGKTDLVVSGQRRMVVEGQEKLLAPEKNETFVLRPEYIDSLLDIERKCLLFAPHEKLYRASLIKNNCIRFPEGCSYGEDLIFNYRYLSFCQSISTISEALYHYRISNCSLSAAFRPNQFEQDYSQWKIVRDFHLKKGLWNDNVEKYLYQRLWGIVYDGIFLYPKLYNPPQDYLSKILSIPEISDLKRHQDSFSCDRWIKWFILFRLDIAFVQYFKLKKS